MNEGGFETVMSLIRHVCLCTLLALAQPQGLQECGNALLYQLKAAIERHLGKTPERSNSKTPRLLRPQFALSRPDSRVISGLFTHVGIFVPLEADTTRPNHCLAHWISNPCRHLLPLRRPRGLRVLLEIGAIPQREHRAPGLGEDPGRPARGFQAP